MLVVILMLILSTGITPSTSLSATSMCVSTNAINESQLRLSESGLGGKQQAVQWLPTRGRFEPRPITTSPVSVGFKELMKKFFLPGGSMTSDYYRYTMWRFSQRFVSATCGVFGTQALLMALGVKQRHNLGINAATMWVLKDALGKVSRILWASNGKRFDPDAKKWRFRSSLLYSIGNSLEIVTYIVPSLFLITAALANALKQMAMLTSSATRSTIYKSFARNSDNIGDITAKGEAQLAFVDLIGMMCGVGISRAVGASRAKIVALFILLSVCDIFCTYNEIRSVVFNSLNLERASIVLNKYFTLKRATEQQQQHPVDLDTALSPYSTTLKERLLASAQFNEDMFVRWSELPDDCAASIRRSIQLFKDEHFIVCLHPRTKPMRLWSTRNLFSSPETDIELAPYVLLHEAAQPMDVFKALVIVNQLRDGFAKDATDKAAMEGLLTGEHLFARVESALRFLKETQPQLESTLTKAGWDMSRFMFGNISARVSW